MNILSKSLKIFRNTVEALSTTANRASSFKSTRSGSGSVAVLMAMATLAGAAIPKVYAQTAPPYVVYSTTALSGTGSPANPNANFGEFRGHAAFNSRGDLFVQDSIGNTFQYPANGGTANLLFTDSQSSGTAGVAVDPSDNLYIGIFTYSGPSGTNDQNSDLYEFPSTNGSYPGAYIFNSNAPPGSCTPASAVGVTPVVIANTGVCSVGFFQGAIYYYWQGPKDVAVDGQGNNYTITHDNNTNGADGTLVTLCSIFCAQQIAGNGATDYTVTLPNALQTIAADYAGDLYAADNTSVYVIPAGSPSTSNTPKVFDSTYTQPWGVSFDPSGNLYVTDTVGIWKVPSLEASGAPCKGGTDVCTLTATSKYLLIAVSNLGAGFYYPSYLAPAIDNHGNIVFSPSSGNLVKYSLSSGVFPSAQIGATGSTILNFTVEFNSATTITSFSAVQGSAPATEFTVTPGTCTTGSVFAASSGCSFSATFTPSGIGLREGAVAITDSTGKTTYTYLSGVGLGTGVTVDPGTPTQIASGFKKSTGVAVDVAGNVYVADSVANTVTKYPVGGGTAVGIGTGLSAPTGVAVDAAGSVYIVNQGKGATGGSIVEVPNVAGVLTTQMTLVSGLNLPTDIIVDGQGNIYVSATGSNAVFQLSSAGRISASAAMVSRGIGLLGPTGLALDTSGNLYVADTGNNRVLELADGSQTPVGSGLTAPTGVTTDPSGAVIIADGTGRIIRVPNESFGANAIGLNEADEEVLSSPLSYPYSIRSDNSGNLFVSDNVANVVDELQRTTGTVNFGAWNLNTVSDAQTIVLSNIGTSDLIIGNPPFAAPPTSSEFTAASGSGSLGCGAGAFHSGYQCTVITTFKPTVTGKTTYPLVFNAPAQNTAAPAVNLVGTGVSEGSATLTLVQVAPTTATISYGQQIVISAKVTPANSTTVPTGFVVFTFDGQNQRPVALDGTGAASITFNGLDAGSNTLSAYYEGDANYASLVSAVLPLVIQQAGSTDVFTVVGDSAIPLSVQPVDPITFTATIVPAVTGTFSGSVNFINPATNTPYNPAPIRLGQPNNMGQYVVSFTMGSSSQMLPLGNYSVEAVFSGNTNYYPTTSAVVPYIVINTTYIITQDVTSVVATKTAPGVVNLVVTDYSNFQGNVSLQCSGLPANTYCVFRPASADLIPAVSQVLQNTQLTPLTIYPVPVQLQIVVDTSAVPIEGSVYWIGALMLGLGLIWRRKVGAGKFKAMSLGAVLCIAGLSCLSGCGSGSSNAFPTPTGTYAVTITGTATPLLSNGSEPLCSYQNCNLPEGPSNPSVNVIKTLNVNLSVK